jgi:hypothetical protein
LEVAEAALGSAGEELKKAATAVRDLRELAEQGGAKVAP